MIRKLALVILFLLIFLPSAFGAENYVLSEPQIYTIVQAETVANNTTIDSNNITVTVTLVETEQPPYQTYLGEEFDPKPDEIYRNSNGTRFGIWKIKQLKPGQKIVLTQKYAIRNFAIEYQLDSNAGLGKYRNVPMRYLLPEPHIEVDSPEILAYAKSVIGDSNNPYDIAKMLFADINQRMNYVSATSPNANKGALNALHTSEGVCDDYTALFVASARALNIPARWTAGYLYQPKDTIKNKILPDGSVDLSNLTHAWPEFMLPRVGWVVLDPTYIFMVDGKKEIDYSKFARIDANDRHIFVGYENPRIEFKYFGGKPKGTFNEKLEAGKNIVTFPDIQNHWAKSNILFLADYQNKIIGGYPDGNFYPDKKVTRAQVSAMLNRAIGLDYDPNAANFSDVPKGYWAYDDILAMKYNGIVGGYANGKFLINANITRAELAVMLSRAFDFSAGGTVKNFTDLNDEKYLWARNSILILAQNGIIGGYADGSFKPEKIVTRAEFATFLARILDEQRRLK